MIKNKKLLMFLMAINAAYGANTENKNSELDTKYDKLYTKMIKNINEGKSNDSNYKLIENVLNKRNKELNELYLQGDYIIKPEFLEWQVFYNVFYNNTNRGKRNSENPVSYRGNEEVKSVNLGMVIPIKSVDKKDINLNVTSVTEPKVEFDIKPVSKVELGSIDIDYNKIELPAPPNVVIQLPDATYPMSPFSTGNWSGNVRYSTSGFNVFENLNIDTIGKVTLNVNNSIMDVNGVATYNNITAGVSGITSSTPYQHTGLAVNSTLNTISLDGDYEIKGDWDLTIANSGLGFLSYAPYFITKDIELINHANLNLTAQAGGYLIGTILKLENTTPNNTAKVVFENRGKITLNGDNYVSAVVLNPTYSNSLEASYINNGTIEINTDRDSGVMNLYGTAISMILPDRTTGKVFIKPGNININGSRNGGIVLITKIYDTTAKEIDSNIIIDGSNGLINIGGKSNVGIFLTRNNSKIDSDNGISNFKNLNLFLSGESVAGISRQTATDSENAKEMIIDSSIVQSIEFGADSKLSTFFKTTGGKLTIDSSMSEVFGLINAGAQNIIIEGTKNGIWDAKVVNNADINVGSGAKALTVMSTSRGELENTGNIINNSTNYTNEINGGVFGSVSFMMFFPETSLKNTGNLDINGDNATGIYNVGIVKSINDHISLTGNKGTIIYSRSAMAYDVNTGQYEWFPNVNDITSNRIELTGNMGTVFAASGTDFILTPAISGGTLEITANGEETYGIYDTVSQKGASSFKINGNVNMSVKNGGIALSYQGDGVEPTMMNAAEYVEALFDTTNGKININVDEESYRFSFFGKSANLSGLSDLSNLSSKGITFTGSSKNRLTLGTLYIDIDSNLDKNNTIGNKTYRDMNLNLANIDIAPNVTISGTEDSLFGIAQNGVVLMNAYLMPIELTNKGTVSLTGNDNIGIFGKRATVSNSGNIEVTGDNGIGILGRASKVINDGRIKIGNEGIGIYSETYLASNDDPNFENNSSIENSGSIIAEAGKNAIGIYSVINSENGILANNEVKLNSGTNIDLSKTIRGVGIYSDKSNVTGTGEITVGNSGYGIYVKDADVNLMNLELNLFGDDSVGIYTDGTASFNGSGTINIDGKRVVIFNITSSGAFNQDFNIVSSEGSTYVFQNVKDSEIFSNGIITLSEGGVYTYGVNSAISLGTNSNMTSYNSVTDKYGSNIIGIALSGGNSNGLPVIINGETLEQEATNKGKMTFGDNSAGIFVADGASALNNGKISLGKSSVGIYGKGTGTNVSNSGEINIKDESIGLFLNNGGNISNSGNIESTGNKTVGIYSDTVNNSNIINTGNIKLTGDRTIGAYITGTGNQKFENTGNIITGSSTDHLDPSIGIYNNTSSGTILNEGLISVKDNSIGIYNKGGMVKQTSGNIQASENGIGIYSDSGTIQLNGGDIKLTGTNGIGIYGINGAKIDNNSHIDILTGNYGIVLQSGSELINRKAQTLDNDGVFIYSDKGSKVVNELGADILMNGSRNVAFYMNNGGSLINSSSITGNMGESNIGIYNKEGSIENSGDIKLGNSVIIDPNDPYANSYSVAIYGEKNSSFKNSGNIEIGKAGVGVYTRAGASETLNTGNITSLSDSAIGIFADNSAVRNEGNITLSGDKSIGIAGERNSVITNAGIITMNGEENMGIYANSNSKVINTNTGIININGNNSTGIQLSDGSVLENYGKITLAGGLTGSKDIVSGSGSYTPPSIINAGVIKVDEKFELDGLTLTIKVDPSTMRTPTLEELKLDGYDLEALDSGFLLSNGTSIKAPSFDFGGNAVRIDPAFTQGTNARVYKFENVFDPNTPEGGQNTGVISLKSLSLSFDAIPVVNKVTGGVDVWMEKINYDNFTEGTWYDGFAGNIESNYLGATGNALKLYDKLDMIKDEGDLANSFEQLAGDTYANITQREQDITGVFKNTLEILQNSENNTKENVKVSIIAGKGTTKEDTTGVVNYDYNTVGAMALREVERSYKHKFGYSLGYSRTDFEFDGTKDKDRADTIQIGLHNKYLLGDWEIKNDLLGRVSFHDVDRSVNWYDGSSSKLNSDYNVYGISSFNEIGKRIDLGNNLKVVPYAGLELGYMTHSSFEESGGAESLKVDSNDAYSIKPGIGVRLEGEKALGVTENWKLKGNLGIGYEYELGDMNKQEKASLKEIEQGYHKLAKTAEEKGSFRTAGSIGLELKERYTVSLIGEYRIGESDQEDYRTGINLKAVF